jgi:hypothetical protein
VAQGAATMAVIVLLPARRGLAGFVAATSVSIAAYLAAAAICYRVLPVGFPALDKLRLLAGARFPALWVSGPADSEGGAR